MDHSAGDDARKNDLLRLIESRTVTRDFFGLGDLLYDGGDFPALAQLVTDLHRRKPTATPGWSDRIRAKFPELFAELTATTSVVMDQEYDIDIAPWPKLLMPKQFMNIRPKDEAGIDRLYGEVFRNISFEKTPLSEAKVVTFGSCFASNLHAGMMNRELDSYLYFLTEEINTTFAVSQLTDHLVSGEENQLSRVYAERLGSEFTESIKALRSAVERASDIVFTFGVSLSPMRDGQPLFVMPPSRALKMPDVRFDVIPPAENADFMKRCIENVLSINGDIRVFVTISPVPLAASPNGNVFIDDFRSKASIRMGLDQVISSRPEVLYWPSFEAAKWYSAHMPFPTFGSDDNVTRHVNNWMVDYIVGKFIRCAFE